MSATQTFPQPDATDPDNVADALDSGLLHWVKGEVAEALLSLRQASAAASEAGDARRALELTRAAEELAPQDNATPLPTIADAPASEPRRSRLPEPPAPLKKKFTGAPASEPSPPARTEKVRGSLAPSSMKSPSPSTASSTAPAAKGPATATSVRPSPYSTRPAATPSVAPSRAQPEPSKPQPEPSKPLTELVDGTPALAKQTVAASPSPIEARPKVASQPTIAQEPRHGPRPEALDLRLASLRVRIERVESDGTIRLRLLDLAATASGEDNALLIVPQMLWQELKRGA